MIDKQQQNIDKHNHLFKHDPFPRSQINNKKNIDKHNPWTIKLHGRPIWKFDVKMMRQIYTICSKNLINKDFDEICFVNDKIYFV